MDSKSWLASKGVWGGIIAVAASIVGQLLGLTITEADVTQTVQHVSDLISAAGGLLAIYGRIKATKVITS